MKRAHILAALLAFTAPFSALATQINVTDPTLSAAATSVVYDVTSQLPGATLSGQNITSGALSLVFANTTNGLYYVDTTHIFTVLNPPYGEGNYGDMYFYNYAFPTSSATVTLADGQSASASAYYNSSAYYSLFTGFGYDSLPLFYNYVGPTGDFTLSVTLDSAELATLNRTGDLDLTLSTVNAPTLVSNDLTLDVSSVPAPTSASLLGLALVGLVIGRRGGRAEPSNSARRAF